MSSALGDGEIDGVATHKDGSIIIRISTAELTGDQMSRIFGMLNKAVKWFITTENITQEMVTGITDIEITTPAPEKNKKTKSQIQRSSLYLWWVHEGMQGYNDQESYADEKENKKIKDAAFEIYYNSYMDKSIAFIQKHLPAEA